MNKKLGFDTHFTNISSRGSKMLHTFIPKRRLTNFYFLIIWWGSKSPISKLNNQINKLHETALGIVYQHCTPSFTELLENYNTGAIHNKIIWLPAIELPNATNEL